MRCDGTESELSDCFYEDHYDCGYGNAAGISCTGKLLQMSKIVTCPTGGSCMYIVVDWLLCLAFLPRYQVVETCI